MSEAPRESPPSGADEPRPVEAAPVEAAPAEVVPAQVAIPPAPKHTPWVTYVLGAANVGVWLLTILLGASALDPSAQWLFEHGGNLGPVTLDGEEWRLFTSMFLHGGLLHLAMNMLGLIQGGRIVERLYGRLGFASLYVIAGLAGSLASALRPTASVVSIGASGAIFGVFAAICAYFAVHRERVDSAIARQLQGLLACLAYNVIFGITRSGIDMYAHAGGFGGGFLCGIALQLGRGGGTLPRAIAVGALGLGAVIAAALLVPVPVDEDRAAFDAFAAVEKKALARWSELLDQAQARTMTEAQLADAIDQEILPAWRAEREAYEKSGAGGPMRDRLLDYMRARQEGWEMIAEGVRANDEAAVKRGFERFKEADELVKKMGE